MSTARAFKSWQCNMSTTAHRAPPNSSSPYLYVRIYTTRLDSFTCMFWSVRAFKILKMEKIAWSSDSRISALCVQISWWAIIQKIICNKILSQLFVCLSRKIQRISENIKNIWSFPIFQIKSLYMVDGSLYIQALITVMVTQPRGRTTFIRDLHNSRLSK